MHKNSLQKRKRISDKFFIFLKTETSLRRIFYKQITKIRKIYKKRKQNERNKKSKKGEKFFFFFLSCLDFFPFSFSSLVLELFVLALSEGLVVEVVFNEVEVARTAREEGTEEVEGAPLGDEPLTEDVRLGAEPLLDGEVMIEEEGEELVTKFEVVSGRRPRHNLLLISRRHFCFLYICRKFFFFFFVFLFILF